MNENDQHHLTQSFGIFFTTARREKFPTVIINNTYYRFEPFCQRSHRMSTVCCQSVPFKLVIVLCLASVVTGDKHCILPLLASLYFFFSIRYHSSSLNLIPFLSHSIGTIKKRKNPNHSGNRPIYSSNWKSCDCLLRTHTIYFFYLFLLFRSISIKYAWCDWAPD